MGQMYIMYMPLCACAGVYISICIAKHIAGMWLSCCFLAMNMGLVSDDLKPVVTEWKYQ